MCPSLIARGFCPFHIVHYLYVLSNELESISIPPASNEESAPLALLCNSSIPTISDASAPSILSYRRRRHSSPSGTHDHLSHGIVPPLSASNDLIPAAHSNQIIRRDDSDLSAHSVARPHRLSHLTPTLCVSLKVQDAFTS